MNWNDVSGRMSDMFTLFCSDMGTAYTWADQQGWIIPASGLVFGVVAQSAIRKTWAWATTPTPTAPLRRSVVDIISLMDSYPEEWELEEYHHSNAVVNGNISVGYATKNNKDFYVACDDYYLDEDVEKHELKAIKEAYARLVDYKKDMTAYDLRFAGLKAIRTALDSASDKWELATHACSGAVSAVDPGKDDDVDTDEKDTKTSLTQQMAKLQMPTSGQASKQTGLTSAGVNYHDEIKRQMDEQKFEAEAAAKQHNACVDLATIEKDSKCFRQLLNTLCSRNGMPRPFPEVATLDDWFNTKASAPDTVVPTADVQPASNTSPCDGWPAVTMYTSDVAPTSQAVLKMVIESGDVFEFDRVVGKWKKQV